MVSFIHSIKNIKVQIPPNYHTVKNRTTPRAAVGSTIWGPAEQYTIWSGNHYTTNQSSVVFTMLTNSVLS